MSEKQVIQEIDHFDKQKLQRANTVEKVALPDSETIKQEKTEQELREQIETGTSLKHVETQEKVHLPTKEEIDQEKKETS